MVEDQCPQFLDVSEKYQSSKGELMFAALALPRGWKSRLEPGRFKISHFVWGSRSEWLKSNVLYFLMFQKVPLVIEDATSLGKRQVPGLLTKCKHLNYFMCNIIYLLILQFKH